MICISDISGNITTVLPESLHQGSRGVNKIVLLAPFPSSAVVSVFLTLPNGMSLYPVLAEGADPDAYKMAAVDVALGVQKDGVDLNAWAYTIKAPVTEYSGTLTIQFSITMTDGQLTTSAVNLPISRGVPTLSPTVSEEDLNTIAAYLTAAQVAATAAQQSAEDAADAATSAVNAEGSATDAATSAANSANRALGYATRAETAAANAEQDEALLDQAVTNAQTAAGAASASALEARQYERGALTAKDGAAEEAEKAVDAATRAEIAVNNTEKIYNEIAPFKERLENLESFNLFSTVTSRADETVIPARSAKYAMINILSSYVTAVKSYGANLLDGALTGNVLGDSITRNGVKFTKQSDGSYYLSTETVATATASIDVYNNALLGDGDTITVSIYGSTKGTRIRIGFLKSDDTLIGSYLTLNDDTRSVTIKKSDYLDAEKMNILFAITAGTIVNGNAYIMVVNGDRPVPYYQYTETAIGTYTFPKSITTLPNFYNDLWFVDFAEGAMYNPGGVRETIEFAIGSNAIKVQGAGRLVFEHADGKFATYSITYQEGDYVLE